MIFVADVGGTKARLALFDQDKIFREEFFLSHLYPSFETVIDRFILPEDKIDKAVFAFAGPIVEQTCQMTNLGWKVDGKILKEKLKINDLVLINDLVAHGYGISLLKKQDVEQIQNGIENPLGNQAILAAGTGLGEAGIIYAEGKKIKIPFASEGGHGDFAPRSKEEYELFLFLQKKLSSSHISYERVLSGRGLVDMFFFFLQEDKQESSSIDLSAFDDPKMITQSAQNHTSRAAEKAVDLFLAIYGAESGNAALRYLATGGVYIAGGIAPAILTGKGKDIFLRSFRDKGRLSSLLEKIPVRLILNDRSALFGCYQYAKKR